MNVKVVSWSDAADKENVLVEHLIKISELPTEIPEVEEYSFISVPGGHSYQYISTNNNLFAVSWALTAFKILFEPLIYTSLCCASYFSGSVQLHFHLLSFHLIMSHCFTTFINHVTIISFSFVFRLSA